MKTGRADDGIAALEISRKFKFCIRSLVVSAERDLSSVSCVIPSAMSRSDEQDFRDPSGAFGGEPGVIL